MNPIKFVPIVTIAAIGLSAVPAQAFTVGGNPEYSENGLPTVLSVINETQVLPPGDTKFS
ncbi:MAG: hypothetical protein F6K11_35995, partial [Leptolyngbya sp. SIO3F4]|nr:hypothetical protein [Leptolyngbya sp. SIO3F4]